MADLAHGIRGVDETRKPAQASLCAVSRVKSALVTALSPLSPKI